MYYPRANEMRFVMRLARLLGAGYSRTLDQCPYLMDTVLGDSAAGTFHGTYSCSRCRVCRGRMPYGTSRRS